MNDTTAHRLAADAQSGFLKKAVLKGLGRLAERSKSKWYNRQSLSTELTVAGLYASQKNTLFHYLYGENNYRYSGRLRQLPFNKSNRIVATYHTPETRFRELVTDHRHIKNLDAAIVMSTVQLPFFADLLGEDRAHFVPHGIDVDYFRPRDELKRQDDVLRCVTVGHHLRDYDTLASVAKLASQHRQEIEFTVIARPDRTRMLAGIRNIQLKSGLTDQELLEAYQSADLLMLPVTDATANNTLLEGMACGLPVISTNLQGIRDYAAEDGTLLAEHNNPEHLYHQLCTVYEGKRDLQTMSKASRKRSEDLSWANIRRELNHVYQGI